MRKKKMRELIEWFLYFYGCSVLDFQYNKKSLSDMALTIKDKNNRQLVFYVYKGNVCTIDRDIINSDDYNCLEKNFRLIALICGVIKYLYNDF